MTKCFREMAMDVRRKRKKYYAGMVCTPKKSGICCEQKRDTG
jgi:hypothetical protein